MYKLISTARAYEYVGPFFLFFFLLKATAECHPQPEYVFIRTSVYDLDVN